jgi:hypothetical protein
MPVVKWEGEAREARQGLWSQDNPQKPWEWKRDHPRNNNKKESANDNQVCYVSCFSMILESWCCQQGSRIFMHIQAHYMLMDIWQIYSILAGH